MEFEFYRLNAKKIPSTHGYESKRNKILFFFLEGKQKFERKIEIRVRGKGNTNTDNMICEKLEAFLNR